MRHPILTVSVLLLAAGCSREQAGDSADFEPPVNRVRTDVTANLGARFARLDADRNGVLVASEMGQRTERLKSFDADGDGKVSRREFDDGVMARFDAADANQDGTITTAERDAAQTARDEN